MEHETTRTCAEAVMPAGAWLEALARVHARPARLRAAPGCLAAGSSECDFDVGLRR